jgi:hypothetical protein
MLNGLHLDTSGFSLGQNHEKDKKKLQTLNVSIFAEIWLSN